MTYLTDDESLMNRALEIAAKARLLSPPNPWVGCVIVKNGRILAEGYTQPPGQAHAEIMALKTAGSQAEGADVYVTLEPCAHFGRTPPCVNALIHAKVRRVIAAMEDPDTKVQGKGVEQLRQAGIIVDVGICRDKAAQLLEPYIKHRTRGLPFCIGKVAMSVDGRTAAQDGSSRWITGAEARQDVHRLRAESQAIAVGAKTALMDRPALTVRDVQQKPIKPPLRVIFDQHGLLLPEGPLFDTSLGPTLIFTSLGSSDSLIESWKRTGAEVEVLPCVNNSNELDLPEAMKSLAKRGVLQVLIEGGSSLLGSFFRQKMLDRLVVYVGSCLLGEQGYPLMRNLAVGTIQQAHNLVLQDVQKLGETVRLDYLPN